VAGASGAALQPQTPNASETLDGVAVGDEAVELAAKYAKLLAALATETLESWKRVENQVCGRLVGRSLPGQRRAVRLPSAPSVGPNAFTSVVMWSLTSEMVFGVHYSYQTLVCPPGAAWSVTKGWMGGWGGQQGGCLSLRKDPHVSAHPHGGPAATGLARTNLSVCPEAQRGAAAQVVGLAAVGLGISDDAATEAHAACDAAQALLAQLLPAVVSTLRDCDGEVAVAVLPFLTSYVARMKAALKRTGTIPPEQVPLCLCRPVKHG
jgi:hypothetical protein